MKEPRVMIMSIDIYDPWPCFVIQTATFKYMDFLALFLLPSSEGEWSTEAVMATLLHRDNPAPLADGEYLIRVRPQVFPSPLSYQHVRKPFLLRPPPLMALSSRNIVGFGV